ncbi:phage portal protein [Pandoraea apista]|uniref:Phage portal protein n=2 Tax=Pandoraea apista TaxID=93218 RepID=A0ABX9ZKH8_9BURK|nr:phage portal protein [Pandoraea apista]OXS92637.1 phage portal protein [Pandoraea apista]PTE00869.1 phage portal protein [Pandoraea apista]RRJ30831.1 phage portal protein [Pandoraea apista]RRJ74542.1 phage portal protein [Pandoraea apista]
MPSLIVDTSGKPFGDLPSGSRARADSGWGGPGVTQPPYSSLFPYEASNVQTQEMGQWFPQIRSPDSEINQHRDRMVSRSRDLARNDGWAHGGISRILDNTVGAHLRLSSSPDWRLLRRFNKGFDAQWADEFGKAVEALWRGYSEDLGHYNDLTRQLTVSQQMRLGLRHKLVDGEDLVVAYWKPERVGRGGAQYATTFLVVDPDRLSNPYQMVDTKYMRGGVEIDDDGVPVAYHIRKAHQNDWYNAAESMVWERVVREDEDGWRRVIHDFERDRAGQNRGIGVFTPVLAHMKMLARYYGVELQAATVATIFGTYVTSPYDPAMIEAAMDSARGDQEMGFYQDLRAEWAKDRPAMLNGVRVPTLAPGEEIKQVAAAHPHDGFEDFAHEMLRSVAAALGVSAEQITQDWSKTNYSSARAALLESWKTLSRRNAEFKIGTATPMFAAWLREPMERGDLDDVLPRNAPEFVEAATAYARCDWLGVARGWVDPVKEKQGAVLGMDAGLSTLKRECAEQGLDWEEVLAQRALEISAMERLGIPLPKWTGASPAEQVATPEEAPEPQ